MKLSQIQDEKGLGVKVTDKIEPNNSDIARAINCQGAVISGINTIALMARMELYVDRALWHSCD